MQDKNGPLPTQDVIVCRWEMTFPGMLESFVAFDLVFEEVPKALMASGQKTRFLGQFLRSMEGDV